MNISEKAAYLKGLMDGLNLDTDKAEGKMISAIVRAMLAYARMCPDRAEEAM